jgi:putative phage-type endonuclease
MTTLRNRVVDLEQGSEKWLAWRSGDGLSDGKPRVTSTAATIIAGDSVSGRTPHRLWLEWTGRRVEEPPSDFLKALYQHGHTLEPVARGLYEERTGNLVPAACVEHLEIPWAAASLDGLTAEGDLVVELKCPVSQRVHAFAKRKTVPSYYYLQMQWELFCTPEAREVHYVSYFEEDDAGEPLAIVVVHRDQPVIDRLHRLADEFRHAVVADRPLASDQWLLAARAYRSAKADVEAAESRLEAASKELWLLLPDGQDSLEGGGVMGTRYFTGTQVDWDRLFAAKAIAPEVLEQASAEHATPGPIDWERVAKDLDSGDALAEACERHRGKRNVDYGKVARQLGISREELRQLERTYRLHGDERFRVTIVKGDAPVITPTTHAAGLNGHAVEVSLPNGRAGHDDGNWSW